MAVWEGPVDRTSNQARGADGAEEICNIISARSPCRSRTLPPLNSTMVSRR